jgi:hypothetical protein
MVSPSMTRATCAAGLPTGCRCYIGIGVGAGRSVGTAVGTEGSVGTAVGTGGSVGTIVGSTTSAGSTGVDIGVVDTGLDAAVLVGEGGGSSVPPTPAIASPTIKAKNAPMAMPAHLRTRLKATGLPTPSRL